MSKSRTNAETLRTVLVAGDVTNANFTGADLELGKGGTGASTAGAARTALGVVIGTNVLAPDGDGSALTGIAELPSQSSQSGKFLTTNGSAASWGTVASGLSAASQAQAEAGTDNTVAITPSNGNFLSGVAKFYITFDNNGNIHASHNITSITDNGTGDATVTIATDFSSNYPTVVIGTPVYPKRFYNNGIYAGSVRILCYDNSNNPSDNDSKTCLAGFGDQ